MNNYQEAFDKILTAITEQGKICLNKDNNCAYLNEDGDRCAVGHLIPEETLLEHNRNQHVLWFLDRKMIPGFESTDVYFLRAMQGCHDSASNIEDFKKSMKKQARIWKVEYNEN